MKLLTPNAITLFLGFSIIITFSALFYFDVNKRVDVGEGQVIGTITFKKREAQRKYSRQVVWENLERSGPIFNNDTIRTGDRSEAIIRIKDGTEFTMNENSMVLVSLGGDQLDIEFSQGSLTANRDNVASEGIKKLNIKTGDTIVSIKQSTINISKSNKQELNLVVNRGDALVTSGDVEKTVATDQKAVISLKSTGVDVENQSIVLIDPPNNHYIITDSSEQSIEFSWKAVAGKGDLILEIAPDGGFGAGTVMKTVRGLTHSLPVAAGDHFWRMKHVIRETGKTEYSSTRRLSVMKRVSIRQIGPPDNAVFAYRDKPPIVHFKWTGSELASGFTLAIARDSAMKNMVKTFSVSNTGISTDFLERGEYYWKVSGVGGFASDSVTGESGVRKLVIAHREIINPPELVFPANEKKFNLKIIERNPLGFSWRQNPEIVESEIEIARDEKFSDIIHREKKKSTFSRFSGIIKEGSYFWRVTGIMPDKTRTESSPARSFSVIRGGSIELLSPPDKALIIPRDDERKNAVSFSWKRLEFDGVFTLQISRDRAFKSLVAEKKVNGYFGTVDSLSQGVYFWRVLLPDDDGKALMKSTERSLTLMEQLETPVLITPARGTDVDMSTRDTLTFRWNRSTGADAYRLELYILQGGRERKIVNRILKANMFEMRELGKLDESKFSWTLQALAIDQDRIVSSSPMVKSFFNVTLGKKMSKPIIRIPSIIVAE